MDDDEKKELNSVIDSGWFTEAAKTKTLLVIHYPNSVYAKILINPDFKNKLLDKENEEEKKYQLTYQAYIERNFSNVIASTENLQKKLPHDQKCTRGR